MSFFIAPSSFFNGSKPIKHYPFPKNGHTHSMRFKTMARSSQLLAMGSGEKCTNTIGIISEPFILAFPQIQVSREWELYRPESVIKDILSIFFFTLKSE